MDFALRGVSVVGVVNTPWCNGSTGHFDCPSGGSIPLGVIMKCKCKKCKKEFDSWKSYRHCKQCRSYLPAV